MMEFGNKFFKPQVEIKEYMKSVFAILWSLLILHELIQSPHMLHGQRQLSENREQKIISERRYFPLSDDIF